MNTKERAIREAIEAVKSGTSPSIRAAAKTYRVPKSTLHDRINGATSARASHQHQQRLSPEQEQFLVEWILEQDSQGHPPSHARAREMASRILRMNRDTRPLGRKWLQNFIARNPQAGSCIGKPIGAARAQGTS